MGKKNAAPAADDDLLGDAPDDLLGGDAKPAKTKTAKPAAKTAPAKPAAKATKPTAKATKPAADAKPAKTEKAAAKPKAKKADAEGGAKAPRGDGKFYMSPEEKEALAKDIGKNKKPVTTKELAEKLGKETWKVRRAINEVLIPAGRGSVSKVGTVLTYAP